MATSHLMTRTYFPHFGLDSSIFQLSFGEFFSYFAISWKWYCLTFWNVKKSALFRRLFQYSVICHYSQYIKLALTDFNKNRVFYRICMWLQLSQVLKKFTEGNERKPAFIFLHWRHKNPKITRGLGFTRESSLAHAYGSWKPSFIFRSTGRILTVISVISGHLSKEKLERLSFLPITGSFFLIT